MNLAKLAADLNGINIHPTQNQINYAEEHGLVIVYGASDDLMEFSGAIHEEGNCFNGGDVYFTKKGTIIDAEELQEIQEQLEEMDFEIDLFKNLNKITAVWDEDVITDKVKVRTSWQYKTDIPHQTFDMFEDDEMYCRGIVFSITDLK